jgi:hypothetical protein
MICVFFWCSLDIEVCCHVALSYQYVSFCKEGIIIFLHGNLFRSSAMILLDRTSYSLIPAYVQLVDNRARCGRKNN